MKRDFKFIFNEILKDQNITQKQCAKILGTSQSTISKWLSGAQEPRFFQLQNIALEFNLDANYLLGLVD